MKKISLLIVVSLMALLFGAIIAPAQNTQNRNSSGYWANCYNPSTRTHYRCFVSNAPTQYQDQDQEPIVRHRQRSTTIRQDIQTNVGDGYYYRGWRPQFGYRVTIVTQDVSVTSNVRGQPPYIRVYTPWY